MTLMTSIVTKSFINLNLYKSKFIFYFSRRNIRFAKWYTTSNINNKLSLLYEMLDPIFAKGKIEIKRNRTYRKYNDHRIFWLVNKFERDSREKLASSTRMRSIIIIGRIPEAWGSFVAADTLRSITSQKLHSLSTCCVYRCSFNRVSVSGFALIGRF